MQRYKCFGCHLIIDTPKCPVCGHTIGVVKMCPRDHCNCTHEIMDSIAYCPECHEAMCPICGSHDVAQVSRVTGYLQDVAGWNMSKRQELKDRVRTDL